MNLQFIQPYKFYYFVDAAEVRISLLVLMLNGDEHRLYQDYINRGLRVKFNPADAKKRLPLNI